MALNLSRIVSGVAGKERRGPLGLDDEAGVGVVPQAVDQPTAAPMLDRHRRDGEAIFPDAPAMSSTLSVKGVRRTSRRSLGHDQGFVAGKPAQRLLIQMVEMQVTTDGIDRRQIVEGDAGRISRWRYTRRRLKLGSVITVLEPIWINTVVGQSRSPSVAPSVVVAIAPSQTLPPCLHIRL